MATILTPWMYEVETTGTALDPIISVEEFKALVPKLSATDATISAMLGSASAAVRDWCGWHVGPSYRCAYVGNGEGRLLMLPCMCVTSVDSLSIDGVSIDATGYEWTAAGMVRLRSLVFPDEWRSVEVEFTAGLSAATVGQVVAQIAANALAASPGVSEEHAGNVGITYNRTGNGITGGVSLLERDKASLAAYRIARAW